jgi:ribonuclease T2
LQTVLSDPAKMATHEWYAHGTCSGVTPPEYFVLATDLAQEAVRVLNPVFANAGSDGLSAEAVRQSFDAEFGGGAGLRVGLSCKKADGQDMAYEVKLSLPAVVDLRDGDSAIPLGKALSRGPAIGLGCRQATVP